MILQNLPECKSALNLTLNLWLGKEKENQNRKTNPEKLVHFKADIII